MFGAMVLLLAFSATDTPKIRLILDKSIVRQGETFHAVFSGPEVTEEMSFDILYREPGRDYDRIAHWQDGPRFIQTTLPDQFPGVWRITGVRMHPTGTPCPFDYHFTSFQPLDVRMTVLWPTSGKIFLWFVVLFEIIVWPFAIRWIRDAAH